MLIVYLEFLLLALFFSKQLKSKIGIVVLLILFTVRFIEHPLILRKTLYYLLYFTLGRRIIKIYLAYLRDKKYIIINIISFIIFSSSVIFLDKSELNFKVWLIRICTLFVALSGTFIVMSISKKLENIKIINCFDIMGNYSFQIYLIHQPFLVSGIVGVLHKFTKINNWILILLGTLGGVIIPIVITKIIKKLNNKILKTSIGII